MFDILKTQDGSDTVFSKRFNATYHSLHGALNESKHVFIDNGLIPALDKSESLSILEIGLGTCLNLYLTVMESADKHIHYTGIESFPLSRDIYTQLNYSSDKNFIRLHELPWNQKNEWRSGFNIEKINGDFLNFHSTLKYNLVYLDAFAPSTQNELWQPEVLEKLYHLMSENGILVTFCAKGEFKRNLKSCGFKIESLPGPPGKREMTRAIRL